MESKKAPSENKKNMKHTIDIKETIEYKKNYRVLLAVSIVAAFYVLGIIIVFFKQLSLCQSGTQLSLLLAS